MKRYRFVNVVAALSFSFLMQFGIYHDLPLGFIVLFAGLTAIYVYQSAFGLDNTTTTVEE